MGTARVAATTPLKSMPSFMKRPRRVSRVSFDTSSLLTLIDLCSEVRLSRRCDAMRGEPAHYVGDFLIRHRPASDVAAPVGSAQFGTSRDQHRAQPLIARQREKRIVGDG